MSKLKSNLQKYSGKENSIQYLNKDIKRESDFGSPNNLELRESSLKTPSQKKEDSDEKKPITMKLTSSIISEENNTKRNFMDEGALDESYATRQNDSERNLNSFGIRNIYLDSHLQ